MRLNENKQKRLLEEIAWAVETCGLEDEELRELVLHLADRYEPHKDKNRNYVSRIALEIVSKREVQT